MTNRRNLPKIVEVYRTINEYILQHFEAPSMPILVELGCGASTSVISYYFDEMVELNMAKRTPSGSIYLLPLHEAHPAVRALLEAENG